MIVRRGHAPQHTHTHTHHMIFRVQRDQQKRIQQYKLNKIEPFHMHTHTQTERREKPISVYDCSVLDQCR